MPYAAEHKQETRKRIVQSARRLFNRRGFAEVSIDEIMEHAGLTRGGFYKHFDAKEGLYQEARAGFPPGPRARFGTGRDGRRRHGAGPFRRRQGARRRSPRKHAPPGLRDVGLGRGLSAVRSVASGTCDSVSPTPVASP